MKRSNFPIPDGEYPAIAKKFKLLSEPSRLKIIGALSGGEKCVTEITEMTGLNQANVSKQLRLMEDSGMLKGRRIGSLKYYHVVDIITYKVCKAAQTPLLSKGDLKDDF